MYSKIYKLEKQKSILFWLFTMNLLWIYWASKIYAGWTSALVVIRLEASRACTSSFSLVVRARPHFLKKTMNFYCMQLLVLHVSNGLVCSCAVNLNFNKASDAWSVGVLIFFMLYGYLPFSGETGICKIICRPFLSHTSPPPPFPPLDCLLHIFLLHLMFF